MAALCGSRELIACLNDKAATIFDLSKPKSPVLTYEVQKPTKTVSEKKTGEGDEDHGGTDQILAYGFSKCSQYFAICDDYKQIHLFSSQLNWKELSSRVLVRRCTSLVFTHDSTAVLVADKSGDVYRFSVKDPESPGEIVLGHLSMVLDLTFLAQDKYIATCDRDEKIRVSLYPNSYHIEGFCLGHQEFVNKLTYLNDMDILASGSGDGTVRFWSYIPCKQLYCLTCPFPQWAELTPSPAVRFLKYSEQTGVLAVAWDRIPIIQLYKISLSNQTLDVSSVQSIELSAEPLDVYWCSDYMMVLQPADSDRLQLYKFTEQPVLSFHKVTTESADSAVAEIAKHVNNMKEFFRDCNKRDSYEGLYKLKNYDNFKEYMDRKQKRLHGKEKTTETSIGEKESENKKRTTNDVDQNEPVTKSSKDS